MPLQNVCLIMVVLSCYCLLGVNSTDNYGGVSQPTQKQTYYEHLYSRYYKKYNYWTKKKWPKTKGRCTHSPWKIEGVNPVLEEAEQGYMVVLLMFKPSQRYSKQQLNFLNDQILYYKKIGWKISLIALTPRSVTKLPEYFRKRYRYVKFYQEAKSQNIYKMLKATYGHIITYDECGRQQYSIGPPYSYQRYDYISGAIRNTKRHYVTFCGKCLPYSVPTQRVLRNSSATASTTHVPTKLSTKPQQNVKPTESAIDGP